MTTEPTRFFTVSVGHSIGVVFNWPYVAMSNAGGGWIGLYFGALKHNFHLYVFWPRLPQDAIERRMAYYNYGMQSP